MNTSISSPTSPQPLRSDVKTLIIACALTIGFWFIPIASLALYPLRLFVTFIHEGGHALASLTTGGVVQQIVINPDASGYTLTAGGFEPLIAMAGYLGATAYGALLLTLARAKNTARGALNLSGFLVAAITLFLVRPWNNLFGWGWGIVIAVGLCVAARKLSPRGVELTAMFLGVQCAVNALFDLRTLVGLSASMPGTDTDAVFMSHLIPLPPTVWALLWSVMAVVIIGVTVRSYWRRS